MLVGIFAISALPVVMRDELEAIILTDYSPRAIARPKWHGVVLLAAIGSEGTRVQILAPWRDIFMTRQP